MCALPIGQVSIDYGSKVVTIAFRALSIFLPGVRTVTHSLMVIIACSKKPSSVSDFVILPPSPKNLSLIFIIILIKLDSIQ